MVIFAGGDLDGSALAIDHFPAESGGQVRLSGIEPNDPIEYAIRRQRVKVGISVFRPGIWRLGLLELEGDLVSIRRDLKVELASHSLVPLHVKEQKPDFICKARVLNIAGVPLACSEPHLEVDVEETASPGIWEAMPP
jgi:hypothetical protein